MIDEGDSSVGATFQTHHVRYASDSEFSGSTTCNVQVHFLDFPPAMRSIQNVSRLQLSI